MMNDKQINEYMGKLFESQGAGLQGLEIEAFRRFGELSGQMDQMEKRLRMLEQEAANLRNNVVRLSGQREAFAQILVAAEAARREANAVHGANGKPDLKILPKDGLTLEEFGKQIGADKVELVNHEGKVVGSSDDPAATPPNP